MTTLPLARRSAMLDGRARLAPVQRLELLCDSCSLRTIRTTVQTRIATRKRAGDGVVGAMGTVAGRPVACYAQDGSFAGGSLGEVHAETILRVLTLAGRAGAPVVGFIESGGARMDDGVGALAAYGRIFRRTVALSGYVPQISVITGCSAGGGAYAPALTDFIVMTAEATMFLTGPSVVREATGEDVTKDELGGPRVHARNGVCHFVASDDADAVRLVQRLLAHLPQNTDEPLPCRPPRAPAYSDPAAFLPADGRLAYDVRGVVRALVDGGELIEASPRWARNMVTAIARLDGRPVALIANQPRYLGGVIDAQAAQKGARFVKTCDALGLPLLVLVDTPGFLPGTRQETAGVIRYGADLVHAFAAATVPKITVVLRKAYGGGFITMNAKDLGADLVLAWPDAEIGIMSPRQAVAILHRRELLLASAGGDGRAVADAGPVPTLDDLAASYLAEHVSASAAARSGHLDELVEPRETRDRLELALGALTRRNRGRALG